MLFWFPVTTGPRPQSNGSAWVPEGTSLGASAAENQAIQSGNVIEERAGLSLPAGLDVANVAAVQAAFLQYWTIRASQINGKGLSEYYGVFEDPGVGVQQG